MAENSVGTNCVGPASPSPASPPTSQTSPALTSPAVTTTPTSGAVVPLSEKELAALPPDIAKQIRLRDSYVTCLEERVARLEGEFNVLKEGEERLRTQYTESQQREKVLVRRLAAKEQEMQDVAAQMTELKSSQTSTPSALRSVLLDPAVNLLLQRLRHELLTSRTRFDETQNELSAWKFTPDSNTGKRLMAKCRLLHTENEELGKLTNSGRVAKLEGELALQKSFSEEVKKSQSELDEFLQDLDEDVEGMQSTIYYLQQELRKAKDKTAGLERELAALRCSTNNVESGGETLVKTELSERSGNGDVEMSQIKTETQTPPQQKKLNGNCKSACDENCRTPGVDSDSEPESKVNVVNKDHGDDDTRDVKSPSAMVNGDAKRTYDSDSSESNLRTNVTKKVRRSSVLSLEYNEDNMDDDALIISTNGDGSISDAE